MEEDGKIASEIILSPGVGRHVSVFLSKTLGGEREYDPNSRSQYGKFVDYESADSDT